MRAKSNDKGKNIEPSLDSGKHTELHHVTRANTLVWAKDEDNPDYRLVVINAANEGFQSKMSLSKGSYVITQLTQRLGDNIGNDNNKRFLNEILGDIQEDLHHSGKQLMVKTFNNKTEYIKFVKNKVGGTKSKQEQEEEMIQLKSLKGQNDYILLSDS